MNSEQLERVKEVLGAYGFRKAVEGDDLAITETETHVVITILIPKVIPQEAEHGTS